MERLKQRGRNRKQRERKSFIVIKSEGDNKTEQIYFKNLRSRECIIKFPDGNSTDPVGMANELVSFMNSEDINSKNGDKIYLLIDTDVNANKQNQIDEAKKICDKYGIELITSTPAFEFWYMLHFGYTTGTYSSSKDIKREMKKKIPGYTESKNVYPIIKDNTDEAMDCAERVEKFHKQNGRKIDSEDANPHTSAYRVLKEIKKRKNNKDT